MSTFKSQEKLSNKTVERKVFYSSVKRKKDERDYFDEDEINNNNVDNMSNMSSSRYQTPNVSKVSNQGATSTRLTKGDKILALKQASVNVSRFSFSQSPQPYTPKQI